MHAGQQPEGDRPMTTPRTATSFDVEHARALAKLSTELDARSAQRLIIGAGARLAPRPTLVVPVEAWRDLFAIGGPSIDKDGWRRRKSLMLSRGCADEKAPRLASAGRPSRRWLDVTPRG